MSDLMSAARLGNYPVCEKILNTKIRKSGFKIAR